LRMRQYPSMILFNMLAPIEDKIMYELVSFQHIGVYPYSKIQHHANCYAAME